MTTLKHVPNGLKRRRVWLLWRMEHGDRKVPYYINGKKRTGTLDEPEDRDELATFDDALAAFQRRRGKSNSYTGLAVALGADDEGTVLSGIDLDDCINTAKGGKLTALANEVLTAAGCTYTEISPSGRGLKLFGIGDVGTLVDHANHVEIYSGKRFFTVTGRPFASSCKRLARLKNAAFVARSRSSKAEKAPTPGVKAVAGLPAVGQRISEGGRNTAVSKEAYRLRKEGYSEAAVLAVAHAFNDAVCDPPLSASEVEACVRGKRTVQADDKSTVHRLENFYAYNPTRKYINVIDFKMWVPATIDNTLPPVSVSGFEKPIPASRFLDQKRAVQSVIWAPGLPQIIEGKVPTPDGLGWRSNRDARCFNNYVPPAPMKGKPNRVKRWLKHLERLYPDDCGHLINWMAHRVQKPGEKINHALVMGGSPGIGKDTVLWPLRVAVGESNWQDITPRDIFGSFNAFVKSVVLNIGEARDLGESNRYQFYEHMKPLLAAPPDAFLCNEKFIPAYVVANVTGVVITTNHLYGGMYLPVDDRRHYVAWSTAQVGDDGFTEDVFTALWDWYNLKGGAVNVATFLAQRDLSTFNPKAPPLKTPAFYQMVDSHQSVEHPMILNALDALGMPAFVTLGMLVKAALPREGEQVQEIVATKAINHILLELGYERVRNPRNKQGLWTVAGSRAAVYANAEKVSHADREKQAAKFAETCRKQR